MASTKFEELAETITMKTIAMQTIVIKTIAMQTIAMKTIFASPARPRCQYNFWGEVEDLFLNSPMGSEFDEAGFSTAFYGGDVELRQHQGL